MRTTLMVLVITLLGGTALARVTLRAPNGTAFDIEDNDGGQLSAPAAFEGWPQLCVRVCADCDAPCAAGDVYDVDGAASATELNGVQVVMAGQLMAGLDVRRKVFVPSAGQADANGFVRFLDLLTNNTGAPITVEVRVGSTSLGGGALARNGHTIWRTSSDDADLGPEDRWFITDDVDAVGGIGALGVLVQGAGARSRPERLEQNFADQGRSAATAWAFRDVTVAPGETAAFLTVIAHEPRRADAIDEVVQLLRMSPVDVLFGLNDDERRAIRNFDVDPANSSPVADAGGPYSAEEGQQVQLTAVRSSDPDAGQLTYEWDLDDDGEFDDFEGANAVAEFDDDGVYAVRVQVTDEGGKTDIDAARVIIRNVDPRIDGVNTDSPIIEGSRLTVEVQAVDPGGDPMTYDFDWDGDGNYDDVGLVENRQAHRYVTDGVFDARVRVNDDDGGSTVQGFRVQVDNVGPTIRQVVTNSPAFEGSQVNILVVANDPGGDPITYAYDLDDDGIYEISEVGLTEVQTSFDDDGLFRVRIRLTDDQGASSERELDISILNARPEVVSATNTGPVMEGQRVTIDVDATDPGADELTYSFDLDTDGEFEDDVVDQVDPFVEHIYRQQGRYVVGVRVRDDDGGLALGSTTVEVLNAPPTVEIQAPDFVNEGEGFDVSCPATDPGDDVLVYDWDITGDGNFDLVAVPEDTQRTSFQQQGDFTVRCRVTDGDAQVSAEAVIRVRNVRPILEVEVPEEANEGAEIVVRALAEDPGNDELLFSYDFDGDGVFEVTDSLEPFARYSYPDQGLFEVRVVVDDGQAPIDGTARIRVLNVAPTVEVDSNSPVNEGDELVLTPRATDPGDDVVTLTWDVQGAEYVTPAVCTLPLIPDGPPAAACRFTPGDEGVVEEPLEGEGGPRLVVLAVDEDRFNVRVTPSDEDDGVGEEAQSQVIIVNLPPSFPEIAFVRPAVEGEPYNFVVPADDPGLDDVLTFGLVQPPAGVGIEPLTGRIEWVPTFDHFLASPITLSVTVNDGDGGEDQTELLVEVLPQDGDMDGLPDTYERNTCDAEGNCLDPDDPNDAEADPDGDGRDNRQEYEEGTEPWFYEGPTLPVHVSPPDGLRVEVNAPSLTVEFVENDLDDPVQVEFEIYRDELLADRVIASPAVDQVEEAGASWAPDQGVLLEDNDYWWRARAVAGDAATGWTDPWSFRVNAENQPPTAPIPVMPEDGMSVEDRRPTLRVMPSTDGDGDALRYVFRIYRGMTDNAEDSGEGSEVEGSIEYVPSADLRENATLSWDVVAIDTENAESEPSERWSFFIDADNSVPSVPEIRFPSDGMLVETHLPEMVAGGSVDLDDAEVFYIFRVRTKDGEIAVESEIGVAAEGDEARWTPPEPLVEDTAYDLEVVATDGSAASEPASVSFFVSESDDPPPVPEPKLPEDGAKVQLDRAFVSWSEVFDPEAPNDSDGVRYVVEFCDSANKCVPAPETDALALDLADNVKAGESYTWTVEAFDLNGNGSGKSEQRSFEVEGGGGGGGAGSDGCGCRAGGGGSGPWALLLLGIGLFGLRRRRV